MRYEFSEKPDQCPVCGSTKIAGILYGFVVAKSERFKEQIETGEIVLGGCEITGDDPAWVCRNCGTKFYIKKKDNDSFFPEETN